MVWSKNVGSWDGGVPILTTQDPLSTGPERYLITAWCGDTKQTKKVKKKKKEEEEKCLEQPNH